MPKACEGYRIKKIPCCYLLRVPSGERTLKLNETGILIWELCNGRVKVGEILELLSSSFPEAAPDMEKDLFRVLDELNEEKAITFS